MFRNLRDEFEYYFKNLKSNLCSFERDYKDVTNFYKLIQVGTRIENNKILIKECYKILNNPEYIGTPDFGGALCVLLYNDKDINLEPAKQLFEEYREDMDRANPHNIRWEISIAYRLGELTNEAYYYEICVYSKWWKFSSLIVNKILMACHNLAIIELNNNRKDRALVYLECGMERFKDALKFDLDKSIGKDGVYIYFSCVEMAELCDKASELVKFIQNIDRYGTKEFKKIMDNSKRFGALPYIRSLENRIKELENGNKS